jgi:pseudouridine synthase
MSKNIRINRFLAASGLGSRRKCENFIKEGRVEVNGLKVEELAQIIDPENDEVTVDGKLVKCRAECIVLVLNKPRGILSAVEDSHGRRTVIDLARDSGYRGRLYPVGRLDLDTSGVLLITDDGDLAYRLTHPRFKVEKRYLVRVEGRIENGTVAEIESGIDLGDYVTKPCSIRVIERSREDTSLEIRIKEGRKRQIRRMFSESGHKVILLHRISYGDMEFNDLDPGQIRALTEDEERELRKMAGLI